MNQLLEKIKANKKPLLIALICAIAICGYYCYDKTSNGNTSENGNISLLGDNVGNEPLNKESDEPLNKTSEELAKIEEELAKKREELKQINEQLLLHPAPVTDMKIATESVSCENFNEAEFKEKLKTNFKDFGEYEINAGVISGTKQITTSNAEVFYVTCNADMLFLGAIINTKGENITAKIAENLQMKNNAKVLKDVDLNLAVKVGNGKNVLLQFTDVRCPYCVNAEQIIARNNYDITRYIFFVDIKGTLRESVHILCSEDKAKAFEEIVNGDVTNLKSCPEGLDAFNKHKELAQKLQVQGTPTFFKDGKKYMGLVPALVDEIREQQAK